MALEVGIKLVLMAVSLYMIHFFASMEAAFTAVDQLALTHLARTRGGKAKTALDLTEMKEQLLGTIVIGTNLAVVFFTVVGTSVALDTTPFGAYTLLVAPLLFIVLINMCGELLPKARAARAPLKYALGGTRLLRVVHRLFYPLSYLLVTIPRMFITKETAVVDEESIKNMLCEPQYEADLPRLETGMIHGLLDSGKTPVRDIMTPRVDMAAVDIDEPVDKIVRDVMLSGFSRVPVYRGTTDNIVGILYVKDLFDCILHNPNTVDVLHIVRPALFIPDSKRARVLLRELQEQRTHIAIVVDEYGGTAGLITIEDLLEEIVGEIKDEYDRDEETYGVFTRGPNVFFVHGRTSISELNEALGTSFCSEEADTAAGLIYEKLGRVPRKDECIDFTEHGFRLCIVKTSQQRIIRIRAERL